MDVTFPLNPTVLKLVTLNPLISHTATLPAVSRQRTSAFPLPFYSPAPTVVQPVHIIALVLKLVMLSPSISHTATLPALSRQRMSVFPSPLKSPVPTMVQPV